jgi:hypothetical protein
MDNYYFSKENIDRMISQLSKTLNIKNTPESKKLVESLLKPK